MIPPALLLRGDLDNLWLFVRVAKDIVGFPCRAFSAMIHFRHPPPPRLAKQGATVGEDTVSGLMFAEDFVGISETPERLQKQREKALLIEYTRKRRVTAIAYLRKYGRI